MDKVSYVPFNSTRLGRHWLPDNKPMTQPYQRYDSRPHSLATVQNRKAQAASFFRNLDLGLVYPVVLD